jgi:hypothetical protein
MPTMAYRITRSRDSVAEEAAFRPKSGMTERCRSRAAMDKPTCRMPLTGPKMRTVCRLDAMTRGGITWQNVGVMV